MADIAAELDADAASVQLAGASVRANDGDRAFTAFRRDQSRPRHPLLMYRANAAAKRCPRSCRAAPMAASIACVLDAAGTRRAQGRPRSRSRSKPAASLRDLMRASLLPEEMLKTASPVRRLASNWAAASYASAKAPPNSARRPRDGLHAVGLRITRPCRRTCWRASLKECRPKPRPRVPVAFCTAYYGLVTLAKLSRGEWVLIHGGAGGSRSWRPSRSRSSPWRQESSRQPAREPERGDLLEGPRCRTISWIRARPAFSDEEIRAITGDGVDIVLNSLAGDAMERSHPQRLKSVRPLRPAFGKRDLHR